MQGRSMSSSSRICTVFSSKVRAPASQASTMFWASWVWGPAAGPTGVATGAAGDVAAQIDVRIQPEETPAGQAEDLSAVFPLDGDPASASESSGPGIQGAESRSAHVGIPIVDGKRPASSLMASMVKSGSEALSRPGGTRP